jgi:hypothetical protein
MLPTSFAKSATLSTFSPDVYDVIDADGLVISPLHRLLWNTVELDAGVRDHEDRTPKYGYTARPPWPPWPRAGGGSRMKSSSLSLLLSDYGGHALLAL